MSVLCVRANTSPSWCEGKEKKEKHRLKDPLDLLEVHQAAAYRWPNETICKKIKRMRRGLYIYIQCPGCLHKGNCQGKGSRGSWLWNGPLISKQLTLGPVLSIVDTLVIESPPPKKKKMEMEQTKSDHLYLFIDPVMSQQQITFFGVLKNRNIKSNKRQRARRSTWYASNHFHPCGPSIVPFWFFLNLIRKEEKTPERYTVDCFPFFLLRLLAARNIFRNGFVTR